jgi:glucose-6-phosphate isomerase
VKDSYVSLAAEPVVQRLQEEDFVERLWQRDPAVWSDDEKTRQQISESLGWLDVVETMQQRVGELDDFLQEVKEDGFEQLVHMGMGGSSLAPLVFQRTFAVDEDALQLSVLDTTDPATVLGIASQVPMSETLFIVASKSGTTAEPLAFGEYFYKGVEVMKPGDPADNFVVVTDPGSLLEQQALDRGYRRVFLNFADIGGRYSALSYFGLVPIALMGIDVVELLARAAEMVAECRKPVAENPGVMLGVVMGEMAQSGRNKLTLIMPDSIATLGSWLEQLIAESTGKLGTGIIPVAAEPVGSADDYGADRLFAYFRLADEPDTKLDAQLDELEAAGHPVVRIEMRDPMDLGREFFRWEVATATAGKVLGINPFDQPNVQESKDNTNANLGIFRDRGEFDEGEPSLSAGALSFYTDSTADTAADVLAEFFAMAREGDYLAILAYLEENEATTTGMDKIRRRVRDSFKVAVTAGYGPRYLHSTGQLHKGGPNTGLFLVLTANEDRDAPIPGEPFTFGVFKQAQALGDLEALRKHDRRVMRIHLGSAGNGLFQLEQLIEEALPG